MKNAHYARRTKLIPLDIQYRNVSRFIFIEKVDKLDLNEIRSVLALIPQRQELNTNYAIPLMMKHWH